MPEAPMLPGFAVDADQAADSELVSAARTTVEALRTQNAIQAWHELDCAIVIEAAKGVSSSRGIAKSQMVTALLQARAKLPEPVIAETDDVVQMEAARVDEWLRTHAAYEADPADLEDQAHASPVH